MDPGSTPPICTPWSRIFFRFSAILFTFVNKSGSAGPCAPRKMAYSLHFVRDWVVRPPARSRPRSAPAVDFCSDTNKNVLTYARARVLYYILVYFIPFRYKTKPIYINIKKYIIYFNPLG